MQRTYHFVIFLSLAICALFIHCQGGQEQLATAIIGRWSSHTMKVIFTSRNGVEGQDSIFVTRDQWVKATGNLPIITAINADHTYESWYYDPSGKVLMRNPSGTWSLSQDSIIMQQIKPDQNTVFKMHLSFDDQLLHFRGVIDFDLDGRQDDLYDGWMQKEPGD